MTLNEYIRDRVYLFFHPIENLKIAFSKREEVPSTLEVIDNNLIKNYSSEQTIAKKSHEYNLLSKNKYPPTSSLQLIDNLMLEILFKTRNVA